MSLMQRACETYDAVAERYVGDYGLKEVLAPISHIVTRADIEVTLNQNGIFISASAVEKDAPKIIIPVTEQSAGRTIAPRPHPLCDDLSYLSGEDSIKYEMYMTQLEMWTKTSNHPTLKAVLTYMSGKALVADLHKAGLVKLDGCGRLIRDSNLMICWKVLGSSINECWKDRTLFDDYIKFYNSIHDRDNKSICMVCGDLARPASQHPKCIIALYGNAKLVSTNDTKGFTYRGRFTTAGEALTVSYYASQKAHNILHWLAANIGINCGGRLFISWIPQGGSAPSIDTPLLFNNDVRIKTEEEHYERLKVKTNEWLIKLGSDTDVVIAGFDAATKGRLSLTYYNELTALELMNRLYNWDASCYWWFGPYGLQTPTLRTIAVNAFGFRRNESQIDCRNEELRQHMQRLISCRIDTGRIPPDIVGKLTQRCRDMQLFDNAMCGRLVSCACAVIRKARIDAGEEWSLILEHEKKDRSYQYGRLLAILEKAELDTTFDQAEIRSTNAIRYLPAYVREPQQVFNMIYERLRNDFYPQLREKTVSWYEHIKGDIFQVISESPQLYSGTLTNTYLMGYYLQKRELYTKYDNAVRKVKA